MHLHGALAARSITKLYGDQVVLDGVSLVVPPRARIGVVGPNGSGKTTLLRVLAGLEPPDSGRVERRPRSLTVAYLPQEDEVGAVDVPEWRLRKAAARVGLAADPRRPVEELSDGHLARANLAALLAAEPDVILLDEPTNNLDFEGLELLERFVAESPSALVSSPTIARSSSSPWSGSSSSKRKQGRCVSSRALGTSTSASAAWPGSAKRMRMCVT